MKLESYVQGRWILGIGEGRPFANPVTGEILGTVDDDGNDPRAAMDFARSSGTTALSAMTFAERGDILRAIADVLTANRERYFDIARLNSGNTAVDASIDIDGAIGTLKVFARYGKALGSTRVLLEPGHDQLAREAVFLSRHMWTTRPGVSLQINAFNFPSWGLWEKLAVAMLAGVASMAKPASATAWLSYEMVRDVVNAGCAPVGGLNLVCGSGKGLVDCLGAMDSLAFTGSADTGLLIRGNKNVLTSGARVTIEADSVNSTILGHDILVDSPLFELAKREVVKALTVKAGQMCTNIRRVFVHERISKQFAAAIVADLEKVTVGDPFDPSVKMGPLVNDAQRVIALENISRLAQDAELLSGGDVPAKLVSGHANAGAFVAPTLLYCANPSSGRAVHQIEVFGPCATIMPYGSTKNAAAFAMRGGGSLAVSLFSNDPGMQAGIVQQLGPWHGRLLVVDEEIGRNHTGHSIVMPQCVHGGPGRAGGGEELGGLRGLRFHMQRSALQGSPALLARVAAQASEATL